MHNNQSPLLFTNKNLLIHNFRVLITYEADM